MSDQPFGLTLKLPQHCGRYWQLIQRLDEVCRREPYDEEAERDMILTLRAHIDVCTACQGWWQAIGKAGTVLPHDGD